MLGIAAGIVCAGIAFLWPDFTSVIGWWFFGIGWCLFLGAFLRYRATEMRRLSTRLSVEHALAMNVDYPQGITIAGIEWQSRFVDVRIGIKNQGPAAIQNLDIILQLSENIFIEAIATLPNSANATFSTPIAPSVWLGGLDAHGNQIMTPIVPVGPYGSLQYRIYCERLQPDIGLNLIIASVAINPMSPGSMPTQLFAARRAPTAMRLFGTYAIGTSEKTFDVTVPITTQSNPETPTERS